MTNRLNIPRDWLFPSSLEEATRIQRLLADRVVLEDQFDSLQSIGGLDVSHSLKTPEIIYAAAVLLDTATLRPQAESLIAQQHFFPYIAGFLGFREAPSLVEALQGLSPSPPLLMIDGQGISHPRGLGIASHLGVLLDKPTIGVAKSILIGKPVGVLGSFVGDQIPLVWKGKRIAILLRSKLRCNPLIISSGHRVCLETAVQLVLDSLKGYRLPEPTRQAHLAANRRRLLGLEAKP